MPKRVVDIDGERWEVAPSGRVTKYDRDEFSLTFIRGTGPDRERRVARYSPGGARIAEVSLSELTPAQLQSLFRTSQPAWTAPETGYRR